MLECSWNGMHLLSPCQLGVVMVRGGLGHGAAGVTAPPEETARRGLLLLRLRRRGVVRAGGGGGGRHVSSRTSHPQTRAKLEVLDAIATSRQLLDDGGEDVRGWEVDGHPRRREKQVADARSATASRGISSSIHRRCRRRRGGGTTVDAALGDGQR